MAAEKMLVWRREPLSGRLRQAELPEGSVVRDLLSAGQLGVSWSDCYVTCNGRRVSGDEALQDGLTYSLELRLLGGKGGFGSMLRALGAQIEKTTNREACRDLSGRRLRDVNHEKAMAEWIKKQAEREAEKEQRRLERLKRKLAEPKHYFTDPEYQNQCSDMSERLEESVIKGLQATSSSVVSPEASDCRKRKMEPQSGKGKSNKKFLWTGLEGLEVSSGSDSDSDGESPGTSSACHNAEQRLSSDSDSPSTSSSSPCHSTKQRRHSSDNESPERSSSPTTVSHQPEPVDDETPSIEDAGQETPTEATAMEASRETTPEATAMDASQETTTEVTKTESSQEITTEATRMDACHETPTEATPMDSGLETSIEATKTDSSKETTTEATTTPTNQTAQMEVTKCEKPAEVKEPRQEPPCTDSAPFDLLSFSSAADLEALGLEKLKAELMALGLKCGGTLQERAARLFSVRGLSREKIDPALFAKPAKGKRK